jgi:hypothetical protein
MQTEWDSPFHLDTDLTLVHRRPTAEMLIAAVRAAGVDTATVWQVFVAMVEAAEREQAIVDTEVETTGEA